MCRFKFRLAWPRRPQAQLVYLVGSSHGGPLMPRVPMLCGLVATGILSYGGVVPLSTCPTSVTYPRPLRPACCALSEDWSALSMVWFGLLWLWVAIRCRRCPRCVCGINYYLCSTASATTGPNSPCWPDKSCGKLLCDGLRTTALNMVDEGASPPFLMPMV